MKLKAKRQKFVAFVLFGWDIVMECSTQVQQHQYDIMTAAGPLKKLNYFSMHKEKEEEREKKKLLRAQ